MSAAPARAFMTIGEVLVKLRPDFPDVTISKIRFLESEGLVEPARTPAGYRKFTFADVERLRYVLTAQRDHYLPLRVIREHLDASGAGARSSLAQAAGSAAAGLAGQRLPRPLTVAESEGFPDSPETDSSEPVSRPQAGRTREEFLNASGLGSQQLDELERYGLIIPKAGRAPYDECALRVARIVASMATFGLEPRHLRAAKTAADREVGLVEQVAAPLLSGRGPDARERAEQTARELAGLSVRLHAALVQSELDTWLDR